jgi:hypothetical protein
MDNEPVLHSLIPLADFKAILGLDDREDALSRYCLITATYSIEQYCKRCFFRKKHTAETLDDMGPKYVYKILYTRTKIYGQKYKVVLL